MNNLINISSIHPDTRDKENCEFMLDKLYENRVFYEEKEKIVKFLISKGFELLEPDSYANGWHNVVFDEESITVANSSGAITPINSLLEMVGFFTIKYHPNIVSL